MKPLLILLLCAPAWGTNTQSLAEAEQRAADFDVAGDL
jgi:hypothetical protein